MITRIVDPLTGIVFGSGVSAQPKLMKLVPEAVPPWSGVSSVPKGNVAVAFAHVIVRVPNTQPVPLVILRTHPELIRPVASVRQHVGQDHEAPARTGRERIGHEAGGHIGPRPVDEHGEADEDPAAPPQFGSIGATSAPNAARQIDTRDTPISSSAQPVNGTAPATRCDCPLRVDAFKWTDRRADWGQRQGALGSASARSGSRSTTRRPSGHRPTRRQASVGTTLTDSVPDPVPDAGLTCSHG